EYSKLHHVFLETLNFLQQSFPSNKSYIGLSFSPWESRRVARVYDPITEQFVEILFPRSPVQNLATIHAHVVSANPQRWSKDARLPSHRHQKRMLREPFLPHLSALFLQTVYGEVSARHPDIEQDVYTAANRDPDFPKGILFAVKKDVFKSSQYAAFMYDLHNRAQHVYNHLADSIVVLEDLQRGIITYREDRQRKIEDFIKAYSLQNNSDIICFLRWLANRPHPDEMVEPSTDFAARAEIAESFILLGLAYNLVFYIPEGFPDTIATGIHPRIISGASPTETMGIIKQQYTIPTDEFQPIYDRTVRNTESLLNYLQTRLGDE
ncbi:MAG: hypothetical protein N3A54_05625, partial [Patescibacteria group bacterium]|nr:hypothetical protein [Patescibacteria group bacterium]